MHTVDSDINLYLQQEILSASPARLRWMLIKRAQELTALVQQLWSVGDIAHGKQWLLRIREIFGELLDGVKDASNPVSVPVSDFYLFLLKLSFEIEESMDQGQLQVMGDLLALEAETWRMVVEKVGSESLITPSAAPPFPAIGEALDATSGGSFSLEI